MKIFFTVFVLSLGVSGCSTSKISSGGLQNLKDQSPPEDKALVYIVRPSIYGTAVKFNVFCNNNNIGSTTGRRFIYAFVDPGLHKFLVKAENKTELFLEVSPGKTYFLEQQPKTGLLRARCELVRVDESAGRKKLQVCKLSGNCLAYTAIK